MGAMESGTLVRLIGDPMEMGAYRGERSYGGRTYARVQFRSGIRQIPLEQIEAVPTVTEEPLELLHAGRAGRDEGVTGCKSHADHRDRKCPHMAGALRSCASAVVTVS